VKSLLAVDLGLKTGLALYGEDGRLRWYRSKNYGASARLKRDISRLLRETQGLSLVVVEGGGELAMIWDREAQREGIPVRQINAEQWRQKLLYPREQHTGLQAKGRADVLARRVIEWSGISRPTSLRHDTAEAILIGLWAVLETGWLKSVPREIRQ
jgi:hypothetical protein